MMKKIIILLPGPWVLAHREDDLLPIQFLVKLIKEKYGKSISVEKANLTELQFTVNAKVNCEEIMRGLRTVFNIRYDLSETNDVLEIIVEEIPQDDSEIKDETDLDASEDTADN